MPTTSEPATNIIFNSNVLPPKIIFLNSDYYFTDVTIKDLVNRIPVMENFNIT